MVTAWAGRQAGRQANVAEPQGDRAERWCEQGLRVGWVAYKLLRKPISPLVPLALVRSTRHVGKGWGPALYKSVLCWGNPEGS